MKKIVILLICSILLACKPQGPVEKQGQKVDEAMENIRDKVTQPGPAEKAGRKIDAATKS